MIVCFDIGGSTIKVATATSPSTVKPISRRPTPANDFSAFVSVIRQAIADTGDTPDAVAISIAGIIDSRTGVATVANIPCLNGRRIQTELNTILGIPIQIANDADCFTLAEASIGVGVGHDIVFGAILGTGIGGGLVMSGQLVTTPSGYAGEWGHGPVVRRKLDCLPEPMPSFRCGCGLEGCLDPICSARGLERIYRYLTGNTLSAPELLNNWHKGNADAKRTVAVWLEILSAPLAMVVNVTGATVVPVGGGLSNDAELIARLDAATRPLTLANPSGPLVVPAICKTEPGLIGAAILAL